MNRRRFIKIAVGGAIGVGALGLGVSRLMAPARTAPSSAVQLDSTTLMKFIDPLPIPHAISPVTPGGNAFEVTMTQFKQQLHGQLPPTSVWGYNGSSPGPSFEASKGAPISVTYINDLPKTHLFEDAIDDTISHGYGYPDVRTVVHLHGAEVKADSDGNPTAWFSFNFETTGAGWSQRTYTYPNSQEATTLWYHDHAIGATRLNVCAGLAGFYLLRDPSIPFEASLPGGASDPPIFEKGVVVGGPYEVPLMIQDRLFNSDGSILYPDQGVNPSIHPQWIPEYFGDTIMVNGKIWPYLNVEPRKYRFRFLDASNARFYDLSFANKPVKVYQIGTDGGYLSAPVPIADVFIAPAERADTIVDFSALEVGDKAVLYNTAPGPYPGGDTPDTETVGQIMQFNVVEAKGTDNSVIPSTLVPVPPLPFSGETVSMTRSLILIEYDTAAGPIIGLLNNAVFDNPIQENPVLGSTEVWQLINLTEDAHPIHLHLVQFQILNRQEFSADLYLKDYEAANPNLTPGTGAGTILDPTPYFEDAPFLVPPEEAGWKDTVKAYPELITRLIVRFAPRTGPNFSFDATASPNYIWHCHILEHEDNEMMRPYQVISGLP